MKKIQTSIENAVQNSRVGQESWRVKALIVLYALGGGVINVTILTALA